MSECKRNGGCRNRVVRIQFDRNRVLQHPISVYQSICLRKQSLSVYRHMRQAEKTHNRLRRLCRLLRAEGTLLAVYGTFALRCVPRRFVHTLTSLTSSRAPSYAAGGVRPFAQPSSPICEHREYISAVVAATSVAAASIVGIAICRCSLIYRCCHFYRWCFIYRCRLVCRCYSNCFHYVSQHAVESRLRPVRPPHLLPAPGTARWVRPGPSTTGTALRRVVITRAGCCTHISPSACTISAARSRSSTRVPCARL